MTNEDFGIDGVEFTPFEEIKEPIYFNYELQIKAAVGVCLDSFKKMSSRSILCFGRPGTGKSIFAKKLCVLLEKNNIRPDLLTITCNSLLSSSLSDQQIIDALNKTIASIKKADPMILVLDEIDSITQERLLSYRRQNPNELTQWFMNIFDKKFRVGTKNKKDIVVMAFTNDIKNIDEAILKRFDHIFHFELPGDKTYLSMLRHNKIKNESEVFEEFKKNSLNCKVDGASFMKASVNLARELKEKEYSAKECATILTAWCGPNLISNEDEQLYKNQLAHFIKFADITMKYWSEKN